MASPVPQLAAATECASPALCYACCMIAGALRARASFAVLILPPLLLLAQSASSDDTSCKDASTTAAMRACENLRYESADQKLNAAYARLVTQVDHLRREKLKQSQRAWVAFRNANADFLASAAEGGTLGPLIRVTAMAEMTEARATELEKIAKQ
jgi:uncharacterized protein YecT (DUF1311 family)